MSNISKDFCITSYKYSLPEEKIAQFPSDARSQSKLLVLKREDNEIQHDCFKNLVHYLPEDSLLIANDSKVFPGRLTGYKAHTQGSAQFLLLTPPPLLVSVKKGNWNMAEARGLIRPLKRLKQGQILFFSQNFKLKLLAKEDFGQVKVLLKWKGNLEEQIQNLGQPPLPPYIKRTAEELDHHRYQTVYAKNDKQGSIAAPTAGFHFDQDILNSLASKNISRTNITLYVGYGTFSPIRCQDIRFHKMHEEYIEISESTANKILEYKEKGKSIIAIGTTTTRALESMFSTKNGIAPYKGWTDLFIYPGYKFKVVDKMITNFHLPESSLLVMISAFAGRKRILEAYREAINKDYRFFSYGDAMLIL